jgi:hypothetical protein
MTEAEWLACEGPDLLVLHITRAGSAARTVAGLRKLRLYACACCRQIWDILPDGGSRRVVELSEQFADGLVDRRALREAAEWAVEAARRQRELAVEECGISRLGQPHVHPAVTRWRAAQVVERVSGDMPHGANVIGALIAEEVSPRGVAHEKRVQAALVRDLYGNPFRPPALLDGRLRNWGRDVIVRLAQAGYDQRASQSGELDGQRLAVLSDALEEAGCAYADILAHLRSPGPHVRGCWALDLILGKQ